LNARPRTLRAAIVLTVMLLAVQAGPGGPGHAEGVEPIVLDFSAYPHGSAALQHAIGWTAAGWGKGAGGLRLLYAGAYVELSFQLSSVPSNAHLTLQHRSAYAPGCAAQGHAPVTITVNGYAVAYDYAPPASTTGWTADAWPLSGHLHAGTNHVRLMAGPLCSPYALRRLEIGIPAYVGPDVLSYQFTHDIEDDRPTDRVSAFSPTDRWAVLWLRVHDRAHGERLAYTFYDPHGRVYFEGERTASRTNWMWIEVRGARAASLLGTWRVEVSIAGRLQLRADFRIGHASAFDLAPRVTFVDMPATIEANGKDHCGQIGFVDPDGDLSYAQFDVVEALFFADFGYAPEGVAGKTSGAFKACVWSRIPQTVTLAVTLRDAAGHESAPYEFTFRAVP